MASLLLGDPGRLYLSIYPPAEHTYRVEKKPGPVGQIVRPGSTSMWAKLRFVNGYSPILAAGVAREFKFAIHGEVDVEVPSGGNSALLEISRPYFRGYKANLGNQQLTVDSYRGLIPLVEVPPASHGRLTLVYRPWWLVYGGGLSILSAGIFVVGVVFAVVRNSPRPNRSRMDALCRAV